MSVFLKKTGGVMLKNLIIYGAMYGLTIFIVTSMFLASPEVDEGLKFIALIIAVFASTLITKYVKGFAFMVVGPWYDVWKYLDNRTYAAKPHTVSILIPAYNEEVGLLSTVKSVLMNDYPHIELIVVNDGSKDNSDTMMRDYVASVKLPRGKKLLYFYKENGGKGRALNYALERATGDIIMSIDADCLLEKNTVRNFVRRFDNPTVMAAVGNVKVGNPDNPVTMLQKLEFQFTFYWKKAESVMGIIYIIGGAAGAFRREVFEKFGGYDVSTITEDIDLSVKIQSEGMNIVYADDAVVYTEGANTLKGLVKQRIRWKYGWLMTFANHTNMIFSRKKQHNKILCWFAIPLNYFTSALLFVEPWIILLLYIYCTLTQDYTPFITWIILESLPFFVHALYDDRTLRKVSFFAIAPISWILFHISTYVEYRALIGSLGDIVRRREATWGTWTRTGVGVSLNKLSS
ncbi:glycosyltransferase family 2 protein [Patescibacteria group bacterium]|nr:glycosyltransferase family 2 protein [Patescibacteria group bacterium]